MNKPNCDKSTGYAFQRFSGAALETRRKNLASMKVGEIRVFDGLSKTQAYRKIFHRLRKAPQEEYSWAPAENGFAIRRDK